MTGRDTQSASPHADHLVGIDVLRAAAVAAVVLFHVHPSWMPGGFVGVDVFFVVSGFVVTMAAASRKEPTGLPAFVSAFYARRVVRIVPALLVCLVATSCVATLLIPRAWLSNANDVTALAAFFGVSNLVLMRPSNNYFAPRAEFNPFTHTWSLGVEEQFYLLAPLAVFAWMTARRRGGSGLRTAGWLAGLALASLVLCAWASSCRPEIAFYFIGSRFWELACGVLLYLTKDHWLPPLAAWSDRRARLVTLASWSAMVTGLWMADANAFPFPWALLPVLATAMLIALACARRPSGHALLLPVVWLGRLSYSLYLWHWPVIVIMRWTVGAEGSASALAAIVLSLGLAAMSWRWIEQPVRRAARDRWRSNGMWLATGAASVLIAALLIREVFLRHDDVTWSVTRDAVTWRSEAAARPPGWPKACDFSADASISIGGQGVAFAPNASCKRSAPTLFVIGDSHAGAYRGMLGAFAERSGSTVRLETRGGCPYFDLLSPHRQADDACRAFYADVDRLLAASTNAGDLVFLSSLRVQRLRDQWGDALGAGRKTSVELRQQALEEAQAVLGPLAARGVRILIEAPKPVYRSPPFRCADWFNRNHPVCGLGRSESRSDFEKHRAEALASVLALAAALPHARVWDPAEILCSPDRCDAWKAGRPLYFDGDHLSGAGNTELAESFFQAVTASVRGTPIGSDRRQ